VISSQFTWSSAGNYSILQTVTLSLRVLDNKNTLVRFTFNLKLHLLATKVEEPVDVAR
jgi:hypothetical protein